MPDPIYFLKVNIALVLLYALYRLLFYKDTFFILRRLTLLLFIGLAVIYPLIDLQQWLPEQQSVSQAIRIYSVIFPEIIISSKTLLSSPQNFSFLQGIYWIYLTGTAFLLVRFFLQIGIIVGFIRHSRQIILRGIPVRMPDRKVKPFSFFRWIFINPAGLPEKEVEEILTHEYAHASQWHSIDVLLCEFLCAFCWINPLVWLLNKEIRYNLEYLADENVLAAGYDVRSYQYHLLSLTYPEKQAISISNHFKMLHFKKRIQMMNKERSGGRGKIKHLIIIPIAAILLFIGNLIGRKQAMDKQAAQTETPLVRNDATAVQNESSTETETTTDKNEQQTADSNEEAAFRVVEKMPEFPGGNKALMSFLSETVRYPLVAQKNGIQGRVSCSFIVEKDGTISNIKIVKGVDPSLDQEAIRVIRAMPAWHPGKQQGKVVRVEYTVPITFRLQ